jgi:hypothetical protein
MRYDCLKEFRDEEFRPLTGVKPGPSDTKVLTYSSENSRQ